MMSNMSKNSAKEKVTLMGGPFHGGQVYLSRTGGNPKVLVSVGEVSTFMFSVRGVVGQYIAGKWFEFDTNFEINDNVILGAE